MADFNKIAAKWQKKWQDSNIFKVKEDTKKKKFYVLEMYPYPSGSGLHMGHARNYAIGDCYARFKRMQGYNVLYPMGYDSFGLPAENAAIEANSHPRIYTENAINNFISQQKRLGLSYDWSRKLASHYPEYYKWNQYFFLKFYEKGLAYRKKAPVNWCPKCNTVLANEQVHDGKCWRCKAEVAIKPLEQWFLKITDYAEELLEDIGKLQGWPEKVRIMQQNWIGKSHGTEIYFKIEGTDDAIPIFTTRADTLYGVTFMVYAPEHPKVAELVKGTKYENNVKKFVKKVVIEEKFSRTAEGNEKEGMFIGKYAVNPVNNERIPIYIGNFVLLEYGAGAVMAVPAHDQRDFEFAKKYSIPIKVVISPQDYELRAEKMSRAYLDDGILINSGEFNGLSNSDAIEEISAHLEKKNLGKRIVQYKLRDWLISRQRYWGTPIPFVYCEKCGTVPVKEKELPVLLPENVQFTGHGNPLENCMEFVNAKCPKCNGKARRETDTMDTFFDSCWYYLRYCDSKNSNEPFGKEKAKYWMPVDQYIGGVEHAVMHLLYARFFVKVLRDLRFVGIDEPFTRLFNQGMLHKDGFVMSKSRGNVITQDDIEKKYGIDTARLFLLFLASPDKDIEWSDEGIEGSFRFLNKLYSFVEKGSHESSLKDRNVISRINKAVKNVTSHIENFQYNLALIEVMEFVNYLYKYRQDTSNAVFRESLEKLLPIISPFTPHIAEEMWEMLGNKGFISTEKWPGYDEKKIDEKAEASELLVQKTANDINNVLQLAKIKEPKGITLVISHKWKYKFFEVVKRELEKTRDINSLIKACMAEKELKQNGEEISRLVPALIKDAGKMPQTILSQKTELQSFNDMKSQLENNFRAEIKIMSAEDSKEQKARQALPGKPSIIIF